MTKCFVEGSNGCRQDISGSALQECGTSETHVRNYMYRGAFV